MFTTIRKLHAARPDIPEFRLRCWLKEGKLPGFWSGNKYLIDTDRFFEQLEEMISESVKSNEE